MSDEVSKFLESVSQLKDRRDEGDEARSREQEEKILQERKKERQARREERARSISPSKSSPANTPPPREPLNLAASPIPDLSASLQSRIPTPARDTMESVSPTKEYETPFDLEPKRPTSSLASPTSDIPARTPTLSWQRRPTSQASDRPKSRPLSMVAAENAARSSTSPVEATSPDPTVSRDQISQALSSKDPSSFRQTADRGQSSAAYRHNQVEDGDPLDMSSMRTQLPGMSHPLSIEPGKDSLKDVPNSPPGSGRLGSPLPLTNAQQLGPPAEITDTDGLSGRTSPTRPSSPTKGMGGFVQSAMMKRTDSVKRWSVSSAAGLNRAGSVASNRNSLDSKDRTSSPQPDSTSLPVSRSKESTSRPASSHAKSPLRPHAVDTGLSRGMTPEQVNQEELDEKTLPVSPSKTMDQRRWSPTKGSWLDAALNKPESPKPKPAAPPSNQPAWMVELNKSKAERAKNPSVDFGRAGSTTRKHEVKTGGLVRPAPMGATVKPPGLGGLPSPSLSIEKPTTPGFRNSFTKSSPSALSPGSSNEDFERRGSVGTLQTEKTKPDTPPKKDFRANLKPRQGSGVGGDSGPVNELQNVFGKLRKANTQKYVAPDPLKDNILKGKAGLNLTGGPRPYEKKDEFKDAILKRKAEFNQAKEEGRAVVPNSNAPKEEPIPEALAKARNRSSTVSHNKREPWQPTNEPLPKTPDLPEALVKRTEVNRGRSKSTVSHKPDASTLHSPTEPLPSMPDLGRFGGPPAINSFKQQMPSKPVEVAVAAKVEEPEPSPLPGVQKEINAPAPGRLQNKSVGGGLANRFNPALAGLLARGPPGMGGATSASSSATPGSSAGSEPGPGPKLTHMTKGRARGPPRRQAPAVISKAGGDGEGTTAPPAPKQVEPVKIEAEKPSSPVEESRPKSVILPKPNVKPEVVSPVDSTRNTVPDDKPSQGSRTSAEFSRRRSVFGGRPLSLGNGISMVDSPTAQGTLGSPTKIHEQAAVLAAKAQQSATKATEGKVDDQPASPRKLNMKRMSRFLDESSQPEAKIEPDQVRSPSPIKGSLPEPKTEVDQTRSPSPARRPLPEPKIEPEQIRSPSLVRRPLPEPKVEPEQTLSPSPIKRSFPEPKNEREHIRSPSPVKRSLPESNSSRKLPQSEQVDAKPVVSVLNGTALFGGSVAATKTGPSDEKPVPTPLSLRPRSPTRSEAQPLPVTPGRSVAVTRPEALADKPLPTPLNLGPRSPTKSGDQPLPAIPRGGAISPPPVTSPMRSPTKYASEVSLMLNDFFGNDRPKRSYHADAAELLMNRPKAGAMVNTQKAQLFQISGDGKKSPVPNHYERVLFEREMYLCSHTFINEAHKKVQEVYFWAGDEVPESSIADAQVFITREARSLGGTLIKMRQGKETAEFMQALGGIIIVRRGSSNKYDSLAVNMLCGRQFLGQIVFDEVDFAPQGLCSGFPYLITQQGKCYLWKGKGSGVDELSCARLIGMDLALMGELVEVDEGSESEQFWQLFDGGRKASSADHWRLRPNYDTYCGRLFCSDAADRRQIVEVHPFSQADLNPNKIYVLDAFFEMYIIVGRYAQSQYASFHNALDFAQEYAILAAGMEDRPFVPISTVVLEGIPRDLRSVFRKWRDDASPTRMQNMNNPVTPSLRRGRSLRIIALNQALQALTE